MENQIRELQIELEEKNKLISKFELSKNAPKIEKNENLEKANEMKELIIKQKEIIENFGDKLKEKEEKIKTMQEELKVFDKLHQKLNEALNKEKLNSKNLEKILKDKNINYEKKTVSYFK